MDIKWEIGRISKETYDMCMRMHISHVLQNTTCLRESVRDDIEEALRLALDIHFN